MWPNRVELTHGLKLALKQEKCIGPEIYGFFIDMYIFLYTFYIFIDTNT